MLTRDQTEQFQTDGYLVIPDVVPQDLRLKVIDAILSYLKVDLDDESTWYPPRIAGHGIVPMHHHQTLWDVRQYPAIHEIFSDLYADHRLWVSMDRASYKAPVAPSAQTCHRDAIHWDCNPWQFDDLSIQGLVYLTDTDANQGPFACVPAIYKDLKNYLIENENDEHRQFPKADDQLQAIPGKAGSLVVFHRLMPHTSEMNTSAAPRFVQYITMQPVTTETDRLKRISEWQNKMPPAWAIRQNVQDQQIPEPGDPALLTQLGRKLVGVDRW